MNGKKDNKEPDGLYRLAPSDPDRAEYKPAIFSSVVEPPPEEEDAPPEESRLQFTLADLFLLTTVTAVFLGVLVYLPRGLAAGLVGAGVLVGMIILTVLHTTERRVQVIWWAMFVVYWIISLAAVASGD